MEMETEMEGGTEKKEGQGGRTDRNGEGTEG